MSKSYTLFLNTQDPKNYENLRPASGVCDVQFYIDWNAILPQEYNKFIVTSNLKSITSIANFSAMCFVELNFGSGGSYDQSMSQNSISISLTPGSYRNGGATTRNFFDTFKNVKGDCQINRPTNNYLRITIRNAANNAVANGFPDFTLKLKFTPIE